MTASETFRHLQQASDTALNLGPVWSHDEALFRNRLIHIQSDRGLRVQPGMPLPLPSGWEMGLARNGEPCFVNTVTDQKFFELPHQRPASAPMALALGWSTTLSNSTGTTYFIHEVCSEV